MAKEHWTDKLVRSWIAKRGQQHTIAIGVSPSGPIHVGWLREMLIGDSMYRALKNQGADARLVLVLDDFDPLRAKRYPFLDEAFQAEHQGKPLAAIPAPFGDAPSYADAFLAPLLTAMQQLGVEPEVRRASEMYRAGAYAEMIQRSLEQRGKIAEIISTATGRKFAEDWLPVSALDKETGRLTGTTVTDVDLANHCVRYRTDDGRTGTADYTQGEVKLAWRIDWPARWAFLGVTAEPFGKDHSTQGGSYDTGKRIVREVFDYDPPEPLLYEWINLFVMEQDEQGVKRKVPRPMASSSGLAISIADMLEVLPPEILRYSVLRVRPNKTVDFDPYDGVKQTIDEFERSSRRYYQLDEPALGEDNRRLFELSFPQQPPDEVPVQVPWRHLITLTQVAAGDDERLRSALVRAGYETQLDRWEDIRRKADYVQRWLAAYAPPEDVLTIHEDAPPPQARELSPAQCRALGRLADVLATQAPDGDAMHQSVYVVAQELELDAKDIFQAIYRSLLGTTRGPRAGWFVVSLDPEFVIRRFRELS